MHKLCLVISEQNLATQIKVANYYKKNGHEIHLIIADRLNCYGDIGEVTELLRSFGYINNFTFLNTAESKLADKWQEGSKSENVNWNVLGSFERKYLKDFGLQRLVRCDFAVSKDFHDSSLYNFPDNFNLKMKYVEECILEALSVMKKLKGYDFIALSAGGLKPVLIHFIARGNGLRSYCLESTRLEDKWMLFDSFTIGPMSDMKKRMHSIADHDAVAALEAMHLKLDSGGQPYAGHLETIRQSNQSDIVHLAKYYYWLIKKWLSLKLLNSNKSNPHQKVLEKFMPTFKTSILYATENFLRKKFYNYNIRLNSEMPVNLKYLYFSLHTMPESNTVLHSRCLDELVIIKDVLMRMPSDYSLVVKLPPRMRLITGGYSKRIKFFTELLKLNRVIVVSPSCDSINLVKNSDGVISIAGTSLLEARIFGKPAYRWGKPEFSSIESIKDLRKMDGLINTETEDNLDAGKYIAYCLNRGVSYDPKAAWPIHNSYVHGIKCKEHEALRHDAIVNDLCQYFDEWLGYKNA